MKSRFPSFVLAIVLVAPVGMLPLTVQSAPADDVAAGRALFMKNGCFECHGVFGQGSIMSAPALAPSPIPLAAMEAYVRHPRGQMPVYSVKILSTIEITQIHAYLASIPAAPSVKSIPLLMTDMPPASSSSSTAASPSMEVTRGHSIFSANCAACHGAQGEGGVGPSLVGIGERHPVSEIEAIVRTPSGIMPRLYPSTLSASDVQEVVKYVASLK